MLTYKEALKIALSIRSDISDCIEYDKGYHFYKKYKEEVTGENGFVIVKENGKCMCFIDFLLKYKPNKKIIKKYKI